MKRTIGDHGTTPLSGSTVLLDIPVTADELQKETLTADDGTTYTKLPGSVLQAAYMLPVDAPSAGTGTFVLKTYKGDVEEKTYKVNAKLQNGALVNSFPILANHFTPWESRTARPMSRSTWAELSTKRYLSA